MKKIGLHLRFDESFTALIQKAIRLQLPHFQIFITDQKTGKVKKPDSRDVSLFLSLRRKHFKQLYLHASYHINFADASRTYHPILRREIRVAKELEFTHLVIHPGTIVRGNEKERGLDSVARVINYWHKREPAIVFLLENTAFGELAIGSNIEDFCRLLSKIDFPDKIGFCIDTAHAYVSGYDIVSEKGYKSFIADLKSFIGIERIALIHLNETRQNCFSYHDVHSCIGEAGSKLEIGLKRLLHDKELTSIPLLTELPKISEEEEIQALELIASWMKYNKN